jgi:hypothetical protein
MSKDCLTLATCGTSSWATMGRWSLALRLGRVLEIWPFMATKSEEGCLLYRRSDGWLIPKGRFVRPHAFAKVLVWSKLSGSMSLGGGSDVECWNPIQSASPRVSSCQCGQITKEYRVHSTFGPIRQGLMLRAENTIFCGI